MSYSSEIYNAVEQKLYKSRLTSARELQNKRDIFYKRFPRAEEIQRSLSMTALKAARAVLGGSNVAEQLEKLKYKNEILKNELKEILKSVNLPENYLDVKYNCKNCHDEGFINGNMCACMKNLLRTESFDRLNKMSPLSISNFETFLLKYYSDISQKDGGKSPRERMHNILNFCKKYADDFGKNSPSLLMKGSTGLGKTHISLAIAGEVMKKGYGVVYGSSQNIVTKLEKERFKNNLENIGSERHFIDCDLLILDDLGTEFATAFSSAAIYNIINSRIMLGKPTIISTNLSIKELEKSYTERLVSRLIGNNILLEFLGTDVRQKRMITPTTPINQNQYF